MKDSCAIKWNECLAIIRNGLNDDACFQTWFADTRALSFVKGVLTLEVPSAYCYELYEERYYNLISSAIWRVFGPGTKTFYEVYVLADPADAKMKLAGKMKPDEETIAAQSHKEPKPRKTQTRTEPEFESYLNPALTFENYCVSASNKLPYTIAENISRNPVNSTFNPFFIYGAVGVGKTHLMQAIGLRVRSLFPDKKVLFLPIKEFQRLYANAVLKKEVPNFIEWFKQIDVLLFDDLQELADKTKTLNDALFPIFNHLHLSGKQLVFTCDRPPKDLEGMEDRLIDRFKWGVTEKLSKPDNSLRKKILTFKARRNGIEMPAAVIDYIASAPINSVREIENIVLGIMTRSIALGVDIDVALARDVVGNSVKPPVKKSLNFDMIVEAVADRFSLSSDVIFSKSKLREVSDARMTIMYFAHKLLSLSSGSIGKKLNRKHSTVIHGIRTVSERLALDTDFNAFVASIESDIKRP